MQWNAGASCRKRNIGVCTILSGLFVILLTGPVHAQVDANFSLGGGVRIGWSSTTCASGIAGAIRYNSASSGSVDLCNGSSWASVSSGGALAIDSLTDAATDYTTDFNLFMGSNAGTNSIIGSQYNLAIGQNAFDATKTNAADLNTAIGYGTLTDLTSGLNNTAVGAGAGQNITTSNYNVALGTWALSVVTTGGGNTGVGETALSSTTTGTGNTALGRRALRLATGSNNTALGTSAGENLTTGSNNIVIGHSIDLSSATGTYQLNIGNTIYGDLANDYIGIGITAPNVALDVNGDIEFTGVWTDVSDRRLKENVSPFDTSLAKVLALQPVTFVMKDDPQKRVEYGFIAQDIQPLYPDLVKVAPDEQGTLSLNYIGLIAPLVKAVQEQQNQITVQQNQITVLQQRIKVLEEERNK